MNVWLLDGEPAEQLPLTDRGLQYGDGLFETIALRDGRARYLAAHVKRLEDGLRRLAIPFDGAAIAAAEVERLAVNVPFGIAKIIVTRGSGKRGYRPSHSMTPARIVGILPAEPAPSEYYLQGIAMRYCDTPVSSNRATAGLKTLERLPQVLARAEWDEPEICEGIMLDEGGYVVSGTMTNIFYFKEAVLSTPSLDNSGIAGIMRAKVLEAATSEALEIRIERLRPENLATADEVFVTNSQIGIWPVRRLAESVFPLGSQTRRLMSRLATLGVPECAA